MTLPKTKDAFAFRDFDGERILQRKFFRELDDFDAVNAFDITDEEELEFCSADKFKDLRRGDAALIAGRLNKLRLMYDVVDLYKFRVETHCEKLVDLKFRCAEKFAANEDNTFKNFFVRAVKLLELYEPVCSAILNLFNKIKIRNEELAKLYDRQWRKEFGERLRDARLTKGLTQARLAELIGSVSRDAIQKYESGVADIALPNLYKLSKVLDVSADSLLGLK